MYICKDAQPLPLPPPAMQSQALAVGLFELPPLETQIQRLGTPLVLRSSQERLQVPCNPGVGVEGTQGCLWVGVAWRGRGTSRGL